MGVLVIALVSGGVFVVVLFYLPLVLAVLAGVLFVALFWATARSAITLAKARGALGTQGGELRGLVENIKDGVVIYDPMFKIIDLNQAFEDLVGVARNKLVGKTISPDLVKEGGFAIAAQIIFPSLAPSATQISEGGAWPQIAEVVLGEPPKTLIVSLNQLLNEKGGVVGFMKIIRDETRERMIIESKGEFIKIAAHQLRTPLTAIRWAFEGLTKQKDEEVKSIANEGLDLSERTLKIINDLLIVSEMEGGRFGLSFKESDVVELVSSIAQKAKTIAEERGIRLSIVAPEPPLFAKMDSEKVFIVISNILDNAIRYNTKGGSIIVEVSGADSKFIKISISDTGVGIPKSDMPRIFSKFFRGVGISDMEPNGSGLGLYVAKNIVRAHGGEIGLSSEPNRGTAIWFTLHRAARQ